MLAQITSVLSYYSTLKTYSVPTPPPTTQVVAVCHSKRGLDIQGMIYHYQTANLIKYTITFSTPHFESPLADFLFDTTGIATQAFPCLSNSLSFLKNGQSGALGNLRLTNMLSF